MYSPRFQEISSGFPVSKSCKIKIFGGCEIVEDVQTLIFG